MGVQWCCGLIILSIFMCVLVYQKTDWLPAVTLGYLLINSIIAFGNPNFQYASNPELIAFITMDAIYAMMCLMLFSTFAINLTPQWLRMIRDGIPFLTITNSIFVIGGAISCVLRAKTDWFNGLGGGLHAPIYLEYPSMAMYFIFGRGRLQNGVGYSGFVDYSGMNAVLMALGIPFIKKVLWIVPVVAAIILSKSSIPYGVMAVMGGAFLVSKYRARLNPVYLLVLVPMLIGLAVEKGQLFDSAKRFDAYRLFFLAWKKDSNWWIGSGPGSFQSLAPIVQIKNGFMIGKDHSYFWLWAHSDWLQNLLENGIIGSILVMALFTTVLVRLYRKNDAQLFSLACGIGSAAIFDFPIRYFSMAFLTIFIIASAYI